MSDESFLSRWSKRKLAVETAPPTIDASPAVEEKTPNTNIGGQIEAKMPETASGTDTLANDPKALPDVATLTTQSDFTPFMAKDVPPNLRNQAMKTLFTDPHYNIMDGLDTYIDDYGKPDPLPADWLRNMNQSKVLGLFDDEDKADAMAASKAAESAAPESVDVPVAEENAQIAAGVEETIVNADDAIKSQEVAATTAATPTIPPHNKN